MAEEGLIPCKAWESDVSGLALFLLVNSKWIHIRKMESVHGVLPVLPSPVPLLQPPALFPILARTQLALQKFFNHIGMLNSAEMSNKGLERERLRIELNSHPGLPCVGGYKDRLLRAPGKVL